MSMVSECGMHRSACACVTAFAAICPTEPCVGQVHACDNWRKCWDIILIASLILVVSDYEACMEGEGCSWQPGNIGSYAPDLYFDQICMFATFLISKESLRVQDFFEVRILYSFVNTWSEPPCMHIILYIYICNM